MFKTFTISLGQVETTFSVFNFCHSGLGWGFELYGPKQSPLRPAFFYLDAGNLCRDGGILNIVNLVKNQNVSATVKIAGILR